MSTIKVTNLSHPSAASPALVLDAAGDVTYAGVHDFSAATVTGAGGLRHIATESFSAVSSVSLNDVFTSDYDNYFISFDLTSSANDIGFNLRLRASGSDNTTDNYLYQNLRAFGASVGAGSDTVTGLEIGALYTANRTKVNLFVNQPAAAVRTTFMSNGSSSSYVDVKTGTHLVDSSFDGFTVYPSSGTITGILRVYGYQNS